MAVACGYIELDLWEEFFCFSFFVCFLVSLTLPGFSRQGYSVALAILELTL